MSQTETDPTIISAEIIAPGTWGTKNQVKALFSNGEEKVVVQYYPDELQFTAQDFVGLTQREASALFLKKDIAYLQS